MTERRSEENASVEALLKSSQARQDPPAHVAADIEAAVHAAWRESVDKRSGRRRTLKFAMAASVALAAGLLAWQLPRFDTPALPMVATVTTVNGSAWIAAADSEDWSALAAGQSIAAGSRLRTDEDSRLGLDMGQLSVRVDEMSGLVMTSRQRLEMTDGAVYLDSGNSVGATQALAIDTPFGSARHVGTQYELRLEPDTMMLRVREGYVELSHDGANTVGAAGDQIVRQNDGRIRRSEISPFDARWSWVESVAPEFDIEGRSLSEFLDWVSRETGRSLAYRDARVQRDADQLVLRGSMSDLAPRQALTAVLATTGFVATEQGGTMLIDGSR